MFTLFISQVNIVKGISFIEDATDDVLRYENGKFDEKGDFQNEIDIVSLTFVGIDLCLTLQSDPLLDDNFHLYEVTIIWDKTGTYENKTDIEVGSINSTPMTDTITHTLVNASGVALPDQPDPISDSTKIDDNQLIWEMNVLIFENMANPYYVNASAQYSTMENLSVVLYQDSYLEGEKPTPPPVEPRFDFNTILSILGTLLVCGFAGYTIGSISVYFLTTNIKAKQNNTIFMAVFVLALAILVNVWFWSGPWQILWNVGIFFVTIVIGYLWAARGIMNLKFDSPLPDNLPIDTDEDKRAVIVLSKGEAEEYNPLAVIRQYYKKSETGVNQKAKYLQPFEFYKEKRKYRKIIKGQSALTTDDIKLNQPKNPYRKISKTITEKLEGAFLDYDLYLEAFVNDWPTMNQALLTVISQGANKITILNLFMTNDFKYDIALDEMKRIDYSEIGVSILQTDFLATSKEIPNLISKKIKAAVPGGKDIKKIGVLLIAEGQPFEWDEVYPITDQENFFRDKIKKKLKKEGFKEENIKTAWIYDRKPTITEAVERLVNNGCKTIIHVATTTPIDCIHSLYDIPEAMTKLSKEKEFEAIPINAWNDNEEIIQTYLGLITNAKEMPLAELGKDAEIILQSTKIGAKLTEPTVEEEKEVEPNSEN